MKWDSYGALGTNAYQVCWGTGLMLNISEIAYGNGSVPMNEYRGQGRRQTCKWCDCRLDNDRKIPNCPQCGGPNPWRD
jgi:hypothetical protein